MLVNTDKLNVYDIVKIAIERGINGHDIQAAIVAAAAARGDRLSLDAGEQWALQTALDQFLAGPAQSGNQGTFAEYAREHVARLLNERNAALALVGHKIPDTEVHNGCVRLVHSLALAIVAAQA